MFLQQTGWLQLSQKTRTPQPENQQAASKTAPHLPTHPPPLPSHTCLQVCWWLSSQYKNANWVNVLHIITVSCSARTPAQSPIPSASPASSTTPTRRASFPWRVCAWDVSYIVWWTLTTGSMPIVDTKCKPNYLSQISCWTKSTSQDLLYIMHVKIDRLLLFNQILEAFWFLKNLVGTTLVNTELRVEAIAKMYSPRGDQVSAVTVKDRKQRMPEYARHGQGSLTWSPVLSELPAQRKVIRKQAG